MRLSVIIPTYNCRERLELTLKCVENQTVPCDDFEIVIVNDGSTDGTKEFLNSVKCKYKLKVVNQENNGQATARKNGCKIADGEILLFIDDDVLFGSDFFEKHLRAHSEKKCVLVGRINNIPFTKVNTVFDNIMFDKNINFEKLSALSDKDEYLSIRDIVWERKMENLKWLSFTAANASMDRECLLSCGGFDNFFSGWGPEDVELGYRLKEDGCNFMYDTDAECFHLDKRKDKFTFYSNLAKNLRYMREEKYPGNSEIQGYILFIGGHISIEEFDCICSKERKKYEKTDNEFYFKFSKYFLSKI